MNEPPPPQPYYFAAVASIPAGVGVELGMRPAAGRAVAAQGTWLLAVGDLALVVRRHLSPGPGPYLAAGPYGLWSPLLFPEAFPVAPGVLLALGWEWQAPAGSEDGGNALTARPRVQLRMGGRW